MIQFVSVIIAAAAWASDGSSCNAIGFNRSDLQADEPAKIVALIDRAERELTSTRSSISDVLADEVYLPAHGWPRFRALIKNHASISNVTMVAKQEPGVRLRARIRFVEADGSPSVDALVYLYHTDAQGNYGPNDADVPLAGSDNEYSRLFCYAKTDIEGKIVIDTIRPGGYDDLETPAHIHLRIITHDGRNFGGEIWFEDDQRITPQLRDQAPGDSIVISPVTVDDQDRQSVEAVIKFD